MVDVVLDVAAGDVGEVGLGSELGVLMLVGTWDAVPIKVPEPVNVAEVGVERVST